MAQYLVLIYGEEKAYAEGEQGLFALGPQAGLDALAPLADDPALASYPYLPAARADFLRRLGQTAQARIAYGEACCSQKTRSSGATSPNGWQSAAADRPKRAR